MTKIHPDEMIGVLVVAVIMFFCLAIILLALVRLAFS